MFHRVLGETECPWPLRRLKGRAHVNLETLQTVVVEVEAILNDHPLIFILDDITDPEHTFYRGEDLPGSHKNTLPLRI